MAGVLGSTTATAGPTMAIGLAAITGFAAGFCERLATDVVKRAEAIGTVSTVRDPATGGWFAPLSAGFGLRLVRGLT